jgi:ABC-type transport system involved in cytochrome c biogenesis permease subunit
LAVLLAGVCALGGASPALGAGPRWSEGAVESARTIPVQQGGRIMPLDTYAGITLLRLNHKRSCTTDDGTRLDAVEWLLDVLFVPERARRYPCFLVEDAQVLDAVGLPHENRKRRDRYSYEDLLPARTRLAELARVYKKTESRERSGVENGVVDLHDDVSTFDALARFLDYARPRIRVPDVDALATLWPGREHVSALDVLDRLQDLAPFLAAADPHAGVPGAPPVPGGEETKPETKAAVALRKEAIEALQDATTLALFPPEGTASEDPEWRAPGHALFEAAARREATPAATLARRLGSAVSVAGDPAAFEREITAFHDGVVSAARRRGEGEKVPLEVWLTRLDPFYRSIYLYVFAFLALALSWAKPNRWIVRAAWALVLAGLALHATGIVVRSVLRGRPPISTLYDTTLFIAFIGVAGCLVAEWIQRRGVALAIAPVLGAITLFVGQRFEALKGEDTLPQLIAVLDTNFWLAIHVTCITIGYGGGLLASAVAHVHVLGRVVGLKRGDPGFYALLHRMTYGMLCFGLFFSVVGTILGGIWANESWGRFWGWDPKENGALLICISQVAILHARLGGMLRPFGVAVCAILSGCVVAFSWWGVNLLGIGLHSYGFTGGILRGLLTFYGIEAVVLAAGAAAYATGRAYPVPGDPGAAASAPASLPRP